MRIVAIIFFINLLVSSLFASDYDHHRSILWGCFSLVGFLVLGSAMLISPILKNAFAFGVAGISGNLFFFLINHQNIPNPISFYVAFNLADVSLWISGFLQLIGILYLGSLHLVSKKKSKNKAYLPFSSSGAKI